MTIKMVSDKSSAKVKGQKIIYINCNNNIIYNII